MFRHVSTLALATTLASLLACGSDGSSGTGGGSSDGGDGQGASGAQGGTGGMGTGGMSTGGMGQGASDPDLTCLQLCPHPSYECIGVDTEFGSGVTSDETMTGCTFTANLPVSGTVEMVIDCANVEACITASDGGCAGNVGECYPLTVGADSFSYMVPNCIQGSLSCSQVSP